MRVRESLQPDSGAGRGLHPPGRRPTAGPDGWEQEVGCYFYEGPGRDRASSTRWCRWRIATGSYRGARPRRRAGSGCRCVILLTVEAHRRSARRAAWNAYAATVDGAAGRCELVLRPAAGTSGPTGFPSTRRLVLWRRRSSARRPRLEVPRHLGRRGALRRSDRSACVPLLELPIDACSSRTASPCSRTAALPWRPRCAPDEPPADEHLTHPAQAILVTFLTVSETGVERLCNTLSQASRGDSPTAALRGDWAGTAARSSDATNAFDHSARVAPAAARDHVAVDDVGSSTYVPPAASMSGPSGGKPELLRPAGSRARPAPAGRGRASRPGRSWSKRVRDDPAARQDRRGCTPAPGRPG